ncbi:uncharacterized protein J3D65DRAFT_675770 [Phyllosticta citribraziliensis]|uniref:Uncharacterized protein n=1 Tax=Phyllosticta citribraziliensis TaxID=989973 RepID=A0ABR1LYL8_9PEZI
MSTETPLPTLQWVTYLLLLALTSSGCGWVVLSTTLGLIRSPTKPFSFVTILGPLFSPGFLFSLGVFSKLAYDLGMALALFLLPLVLALLVARGFCVAFWLDCRFPFRFSPTFDDSAATQIKDLRNETSTLRKYFNEYVAMLANKVCTMGLELHAKEVAFDRFRRASTKTVAALKKELSDARKLAKAEKHRAIEARKRYADWKEMELSGLEDELDKYRRSLEALLEGRPMDEEILGRISDKFLFGDRLRLMDLTDRQKKDIGALRTQIDGLQRQLADAAVTEKVVALERSRQLEGKITDLQQKIRQLEHAKDVSAAEISFLSRQVAAQGTLSDQSASDWELQFAAVDHQRKLAESNSRDLDIKLQSLRREMEKAAEFQEEELSRAQDKAYRYSQAIDRAEADRDQAKQLVKSADQERRAAVASADTLQSEVNSLTEELKILRAGCCLCICPCCPDGCSAHRFGAASPSPVPVTVRSPSLASLRQELDRLRSENETLRQPVRSPSPSPELASLRQELDRLRSENETLRQPVRSPSPSPELASLRQELDRLRSENETLRQPVPSSSPSPELASLHQELTRLRGENQQLSHVHGENLSLRQQIAALSQENTTARGLMGQAEGQWASLQDTTRRLESELATSREQLGTARRELAASREEATAARQEASSVAARADFLAEQLRRQVARSTASPVAAPSAPPAAPLAVPPTDQMLLAQQQVDQLTRRAEQAEQKLQETLDRLDAANATLETYRNTPGALSFEERNTWAMERGQLSLLLAGHDSEVASLKRQLEDLAHQLQDNEAELEEAEVNLAKLEVDHKAEIDNLEDIIQDFQERIDDLGSIDDEIEQLREENDELKEELKECYETLGFQ